APPASRCASSWTANRASRFPIASSGGARTSKNTAASPRSTRACHCLSRQYAHHARRRRQGRGCASSRLVWKRRRGRGSRRARRRRGARSLPVRRKWRGRGLLSDPGYSSRERRIKSPAAIEHDRVLEIDAGEERTSRRAEIRVEQGDGNGMKIALTTSAP